MLAGLFDRVRKRFNSEDLPPRSQSRTRRRSSDSSLSDPCPSTSAASAASPLTVRLIKGVPRSSRTANGSSSKEHRSSSKRRNTTPFEIMIQPHILERVLVKRHIKQLYKACEKEEDDLPDVSIQECCLCKSKRVTVSVMPCRHEIMCRKCAVKLVETAANKHEDGISCPICRCDVTGFQYRHKRSSSAIASRKSRSSAASDRDQLSTSPSLPSRSVPGSASGSRSRIYCTSSSSSSSLTV
ncbi:hypothetical protein L596_023468 [Steinernema carpocapsae]|uniref:RING-type domain-containing protein n=1 Tax=Steinernema carpocapsae TaxID=34508 RepID=A0A4U5MDY8_STECR|nr:hypothetical protein L596_023468 [Steinernema carpocapsae]